MLCKVINAGKYELEKLVNIWLESGKYEIKTVTQTESDENGYITLTIFYYDLKELREMKLKKIEKS